MMNTRGKTKATVPASKWWKILGVTLSSDPTLATRHSCLQLFLEQIDRLKLLHFERVRQQSAQNDGIEAYLERICKHFHISPPNVAPHDPDLRSDADN
ncbi:hypothetical protein GOBAR_AA27824 [Gossypium barbadense]|uniref:Uncharacterized protein n=1 Tax=Gossypium barbadense TaxID=3634 RepID=A0A2P5WP27_GOSBA|nr:hypothetical protein GOBAR_AA27824 [Gossypium barbadense]